MPLFWSFGSANALPAIMTHGGCVVLQESFEPGEALALIERERCSVYYGMANMARALLEHPDHPGRRLGAMRTGLTIGPPEDIAADHRGAGRRRTLQRLRLDRDLWQLRRHRCPRPIAAPPAQPGPAPSRHGRSAPSIPLPGGPCREGEIGELAVGGLVTPGYYRAPELDAEAFDGDGCFPDRRSRLDRRRTDASAFAGG